MKSLALTLLLSLALVGCGDPQPSERTLEGELSDSDPRIGQDDSPYDEYTVEAAEGWTVTVEMQSTNFDTYLWLRRPNGESIQNDDIDGSNRNSRIEHFTTERGTYTVLANSYDGSGRGRYTLRIVAQPGNTPAPRLPAPTAPAPPAAAPAPPAAAPVEPAPVEAAPTAPAE